MVAGYGTPRGAPSSGRGWSGDRRIPSRTPGRGENGSGWRPPRRIFPAARTSDTRSRILAHRESPAIRSQPPCPPRRGRPGPLPSRSHPPPFGKPRQNPSRSPSRSRYPNLALHNPLLPDSIRLCPPRLSISLQTGQIDYVISRSAPQLDNFTRTYFLCLYECSQNIRRRFHIPGNLFRRNALVYFFHFIFYHGKCLSLLKADAPTKLQAHSWRSRNLCRIGLIPECCV